MHAPEVASSVLHSCNLRKNKDRDAEESQEKHLCLHQLRVGVLRPLQVLHAAPHSRVRVETCDFVCLKSERIGYYWHVEPSKSNLVRCASEDTCTMRLSSPAPAPPLLITLSSKRWVSKKGPAAKANFYLRRSTQINNFQKLSRSLWISGYQHIGGGKFCEYRVTKRP